MSPAGETVTCFVCHKRLTRAAALGVSGKWCHADPTCFGQALRTQPSVRELGRQLGLFGGTKPPRGTP